MSETRTRSVALAVVAAVLIPACVVADRLGASATALSALVLILAGASLVAVGIMGWTMRMSAFQVGGATGDWAAVPLLAVTALGLSATIAGGGTARWPAYAIVVALALLLHATLTAPIVARARGYGLGDMLSQRFRSRILAVLVALTGLVVAAGLATLVGERAIAATIAASGLSPRRATWLVAGLAAVLVVPGGARGLLAAAAVVCCLVILGWLLPQAALPALAPESRTELLAATMARFAEAPLSAGDAVGWACAGMGVFLLLDTALTGHRPAMVRAGHAAAVLVVLALTFLASLTDLGMQQAMRRLSATPVDALPVALFAERHRGEITFCGAVPRGAPDIRRACAGMMVDGRVPEAGIAATHPESGRLLSSVHDLPSVIGFSFDLALPLALVLAWAMLVHQASKLFAHDVVYRLTGRTGTSSGRLAVQRLTALGLILVIALGLRPALEGALASALVSLALFLAAAVPVPLVILARWGRADARAALCGLFSSLIAGAAFWAGYLPSGPGYLAGTAAGLLAGALAALLFPARNEEVRAAAAILAGVEPGPLVQDKSA